MHGVWHGAKNLDRCMHGVSGGLIVVDIRSLSRLELLVRRSYLLLGQRVDYPLLASEKSVSSDRA